MSGCMGCLFTEAVVNAMPGLGYCKLLQEMVEMDIRCMLREPFVKEEIIEPVVLHFPRET